MLHVHSKNFPSIELAGRRKESISKANIQTLKDDESGFHVLKQLRF